MKVRVRRSNICLNSRKGENKEASMFEEIMVEIFSKSIEDTRLPIENPSKSQDK